MNNIYLFDVDGTLTPPRVAMDQGFADFFRNFANLNKVVLISGSDYKKIQEQVPQDILNMCDGVYGCSGAECFEKDISLYSKTHEFPAELLKLCNGFIENSDYENRCGNHIEERPGMLNISSVGRNATGAERTAYHAWDNIHQERVAFVDMINKSDLPYEASAGGEISIDIVPNGWNKSVVKTAILEKYPDASLRFFGDRIVENGNDLPLAQALETPKGKHASHAVESFHDTREILESYMEATKASVA